MSSTAICGMNEKKEVKKENRYEAVCKASSKNGQDDINKKCRPKGG